MSVKNRVRPKKNLGACRFCGLNIWNKRRARVTKACTKNCLHSLQILEGKRKDAQADELRAKVKMYGGSVYTSIKWLRLRKAAIELFGGKCEKCGSTDQIQVDHITPIAWCIGGYFKLKNLQVLCRACNMEKGARNNINYRQKSQNQEIPEAF